MIRQYADVQSHPDTYSEDLPVSIFSSGASIGNPAGCYSLHLKGYHELYYSRPNSSIFTLCIKIRFRSFSRAPNHKMTNIQVLDNPTIHNLLINLSKEESLTFREIIERTLESFSVNGERQFQPPPSIVNRPSGQNTLFRPFTSDTCIGTKITVEPGPDGQGRKDPLHGLIVLTDGKGNPTGLLRSDEVTGYRTSMSAMVPFSWRKNVDHIVVFGTGVQALWHTRLILTFRGEEVKSITYIGRSNEQVDGLVATISSENRDRWRSGCSFQYINFTALDAQREIENCLRSADCLFCTTPSKEPLFPARYLTRTKGGRQPFVSAIGSWQPDMIELDPSLLHGTITASDGCNPLTEGGNRDMILVDDRDFGLENCGELVQSGIAANDVVELGEIISLKKGVGLTKEHEKVDWFVSEGFVVYKSVGVSLTDLTVGIAILDLYKKQQQPLLDPS